MKSGTAWRGSIGKMGGDCAAAAAAQRGVKENIGEIWR
jgi:hypothetical protein